MKTYQPTPESAALGNDLLLVLRHHSSLTAEQMLAITSQLVGMLVAMQDQRKYSTAALLEMVGENIEIGNAAATAWITVTEGNG